MQKVERHKNQDIRIKERVRKGCVIEQLGQSENRRDVGRYKRWSGSGNSDGPQDEGQQEGVIGCRSRHCVSTVTASLPTVAWQSR